MPNSQACGMLVADCCSVSTTKRENGVSDGDLQGFGEWNVSKGAMMGNY